MIVYAVSSGCYSDYHIDAVFSTRENAQAYIDATTTGSQWEDDKTIEEWALDEAVPTDRESWRVDITPEGDVLCAERSSSSPGEDRFWKGYKTIAGCTTRDRLHCQMWARDEQHAIKIANERRTAWILKRDAEGGAS